jgi:restriction system protein
MAVPDFQSLTLPVLREFADGVDHSTKEIRQRVADQLKLTPEDTGELLPIRAQTRFANRITWRMCT